MIVPSRSVTFRNCRGFLTEIKACSLLVRRDLRHAFHDLYAFVDSFRQAEDGMLSSYSALYDGSDMFRELCDRCLQLCGISSADISIDVMIQLLFPHYAADEADPRAAYLRELNYLDLPNMTTSILGFMARWMPMGDIDRVAEQWPYDDLLAMLSATHGNDGDFEPGFGGVNQSDSAAPLSEDGASVLDQVLVDFSSGVF